MKHLPGYLRALGWLAFLLLLAVSNRQPTPARAQSGAVVVTRQFGAALRIAPQSDATIVYTASCGDVFQVVASTSSGWYEVTWNGNYLWLGGARVADAGSSLAPDCSNARTFQIGDTVTTYVATGCLSLRYTPSRNAPYDQCVANGYAYVIVNGPIEVNGEDWFEVQSPVPVAAGLWPSHLY